MFQSRCSRSSDRSGFTRRELLQAGALSALGGLALPPGLRAAETVRPAVATGKAKSVIVLYLHGGAPTQDMYDMKPQAPVEVRGEFNPIATSVPGIQICEHLPRTAKWMHRSALVRSVNHKAGCHNEIPSYTGYEDPRGPEMAGDNLPPSMGSVCEFLKPAGVTTPAYVYLPNPLGYIGETGPGAGFLGRRYSPLMTSCPPTLDEGVNIKDRANPPPLRGIPKIRDSQLPADVTAARLGERRSLRTQLESRLGPELPNVAQYDRFRDRAYDVLVSPELKSCFNPELIDGRVKERYGNTLFGNSTFLATKLVAAGVKFVNVTWTWYNSAIPGLQDFGWDTHEHNFPILKYYLPQVDLAYGSLLEDLDATGLLDETLVVLMSDFGRTPGMNKTAGRDHWTFCYSVLFAGAGIRGGTVYGASDKHAAIPVDNPVRPADVCATIYQCLGIDPDTVIYDRSDRPHKIAQGGEAIRGILS
jgi:hypothetical protein